VFRYTVTVGGTTFTLLKLKEAGRKEGSGRKDKKKGITGLCVQVHCNGGRDNLHSVEAEGGRKEGRKRKER
jgi:hypothetical protein